MKLFVTVTERGLVSVYIGPKEENRKSELDEEGQFLELKIAFPEVRGNLELWKNFVEEQNFYGLWVNVDHDRSCIDYLPVRQKDYNALVKFFEE